MDMIEQLLNSINSVVWGPLILVLILGTGFYLMIGLKFLPIRKIGPGFRLMWRGRKKGDADSGDISPFQALMTSLAGTIGTGNIAGVATAIFLGGPGALFWMWCTALVGMATKYSEVLLAVHFRERDKIGFFVGGPMYAIKNGLSKKWQWLAVLFALFGGLAGFGIGSTVQANSMADALHVAFGLPTWATGLIVMVLIGLVVIGGIRRIGRVAAMLVPFMSIAYIVAALIVVAINIKAVPAAFSLIFTYAFNPIAATGGFAGAAVMAAIRFGVARGIFSNEAGLGTAGIAQAAGTTRNPVRSGLIGMLGTFIDTLIICTLTGLAIITSGLWSSGANGAALSSAAFEAAMPGVGNYVIAISLAIFAFTTILGWSYYSERCWEFLLGIRAIMPFRVIYTLSIPIGAVVNLNLVWLLADVLNALMAFPNLLSLILLSPVVFALTREHFKNIPKSGF